MQLTIQDVEAVSDLVGSIAVLITLVYLAVQTKQTQKIVLAQSRQAWADTTQSGLLTVADSEHIAPIITKLEDAGFPDDPSAIKSLDLESMLAANASSRDVLQARYLISGLLIDCIASMAAHSRHLRVSGSLVRFRLWIQLVDATSNLFREGMLLCQDDQ